MHLQLTLRTFPNKPLFKNVYALERRKPVPGDSEWGEGVGSEFQDGKKGLGF